MYLGRRLEEKERNCERLGWLICDLMMEESNNNGGGNDRNRQEDQEEEGEEELRLKKSNNGGGGCGGGGLGLGLGKGLIMMVCGSLVYYHCAYRESSLLSLLSDVFIVLLCSLAILGLLFRHINIQVPVDPLEWQISQEAANCLFASLANTLGAAESVLRVAATGHDKRLFLKVVASLYVLSALGRLVSGVTLAYAGLCLFCLYIVAENSPLITTSLSRFFFRRECVSQVLDDT